MIKIENLSKKYKNKIIFEKVNLEIKENKVTAIMGKSGIGKTTLVKILMGLEMQDEGTIKGLENKKISVVFQEDRLCENLSSLVNVSLVCDKKIKNSEIERELIEIGLEESIKKVVKELSGGMKRRVAIVRSLMVNFDLLILDEPFKGLDKETKIKVLEYLKRKIENKTVILITHDIEEAKLLNSDIIYIQ